MYTKTDKHGSSNLCDELLPQLQIIEKKCDKITNELSEIREQFASLLPTNINTLIESIEHSAEEMHKQSVLHREFVERSIHGESKFCLIRKI